MRTERPFAIELRQVMVCHGVQGISQERNGHLQRISVILHDISRVPAQGADSVISTQELVLPKTRQLVWQFFAEVPEIGLFRPCSKDIECRLMGTEC